MLAKLLNHESASDMILRNKNTGEFFVYDIVNNQITTANGLGAVGLDWSLGGFAADPPTVSGAFADMSNDQLVQAMAGFGESSGAADGLNAAPLNADTSQQTLLTAPQQLDQISGLAHLANSSQTSSEVREVP